MLQRQRELPKLRRSRQLRKLFTTVITASMRKRLHPPRSIHLRLHRFRPAQISLHCLIRSTMSVSVCRIKSRRLLPQRRALVITIARVKRIIVRVLSLRCRSLKSLTTKLPPRTVMPRWPFKLKSFSAIRCLPRLVLPLKRQAMMDKVVVRSVRKSAKLRLASVQSRKRWRRA